MYKFHSGVGRRITERKVQGDNQTLGLIYIISLSNYHYKDSNYNHVTKLPASEMEKMCKIVDSSDRVLSKSEVLRISNSADEQ